MLRRSLLLRLLGLSLAVAVLAVAATAWLTTRETGERFRGEVERTLEVDTFIYQELIAYALDHESWDGVDSLVDRLADETGRRVALTTEDGDLLADSAGGGSGGSPPLPSTSTAEVNPLAPSSTSLATVEAAAAGVYTVGSYSSAGAAVPAPEETLVGLEGATSDSEVVASTAGGSAVRVDGLLTTAGVPSGWRMTQAEAARRAALTSQASECLRDAVGIDAELVVEPAGQVLLFDLDSNELVGAVTGDGVVSIHDDANVTTQDQDGETAAETIVDCVPDELGQASEAALEYNQREIELVEACLADEGLPYSVTTDNSGMSRLFMEGMTVTADGGGGARQRAELEAWNSCVADARTDAMSEFVAEPALLYTGSVDRFDPFGAGWWRTVLVALGVLVVASGVTVLAGRQLTSPIRALTTAAGRMGSGDHSARVNIRGRDEVGQLAQAFNSMAESIQRNDTQRRAMVSDIAHELRTPLANVRGYLEAAEDGVVPLDPALVTSLLEESALLQRLIDDLQDLALADAGMLRIHPEPQRASDLARQVVTAHQAGADESGVTLRLDADDVDNAGAVGDGNDPSACRDSRLPGECPSVADLHVDPERIRQALGNLVANAVRFTGAGGEVTVTVRHEGPSVVLAVADDGPGIPTEHLPLLFDRFYRVEGSRSRETGGSGLSLAIAKHLIEAHDGSIEVISTEGVGSVFTIRLPAREDAVVGSSADRGVRAD